MTLPLSYKARADPLSLLQNCSCCVHQSGNSGSIQDQLSDHGDVDSNFLSSGTCSIGSPRQHYPQPDSIKFGYTPPSKSLSKRLLQTPLSATSNPALGYFKSLSKPRPRRIRAKQQDTSSKRSRKSASDSISIPSQNSAMEQNDPIRPHSDPRGHANSGVTTSQVLNAWSLANLLTVLRKDTFPTIKSIPKLLRRPIPVILITSFVSNLPQ